VERPQPVLLQSGDIAIMSDESRLSYHGVPKILPARTETWNISSLDTLNVTTACKHDEEKESFHKKIKLDDSSSIISQQKNSTPLSPLSSFKHDCDNFQATINDRDILSRLQNTAWTPFLQNYICKSRINLNIRQVLFPGQNCLCTTDSEFKTNRNGKK